MKRRAHHVWLTLGKELRETLRDRRTLAVMILLPLVVYPLIALVAAQVVSIRSKSQEARASQVAVIGEGPIADQLREELRRAPKQFALQAPVSVGAALSDVKTSRLDAVALVGPAGGAGRGEPPLAFEVAFDATRDESRKAESRLSDRLETLATAACERPFTIERRNLAKGSELSGYALSRVLPLVIVLMVLLGSFYPAIDVTAGERERGTLETLLAAPVRRTDLLLGKVLAVAVLASATGLLNLMSMSLTIGQMLRLARTELHLGIPWSRALATALVIPPTALLLAGLFVAIGALARGFKEAQNLLVPAYFLFIAPAMVGTLGDFPLTGVAPWIPGLNVTLLARDLALGKATLVGALLVLGATLAYSGLFLRLADRLYTSEGFLDPGAAAGDKHAKAWRERRPGPASAGEALVVYAVGLLLLVFVFAPLQQRHLVSGLLLAQWGGLLGLVLVYARVARRDLAEVLGARSAPAVSVAGAALVGVSAWFVVGLVSNWIVPVPREVIAELRKAVTATGTSGLVSNVLVMAVTPAVCEEALFRGVLLRGLLSRVSPGVAIAIDGVLFGLFHLSPWRFVPTATLGVALAWLAWRSGSILPAVIAHLLNNTALVLLANAGVDERLEAMAPAIQGGLLSGAVALAALGVVAVSRAARRAPRQGSGTPDSP